MEYIKNFLIKRIDIGCGRQNEKYKDCFGIDINAGYQPDLIHNCEAGIPFSNASLEFINSDNSLEHFKNSYFILQECYRVLKSGGRMRLVVPNAQYFPLVIVNIFFDLSKFWYWYMNLPFKKGRSIHYTNYTKFLIEMFVKDVGFKIINSKGRLYSKEILLELKK